MNNNTVVKIIKNDLLHTQESVNITINQSEDQRRPEIQSSLDMLPTKTGKGSNSVWRVKLFFTTVASH